MEDDSKIPSIWGNLSLITGVLALLFALSFYQQFSMISLSLLLAVPGLFLSISCLLSKKNSRMSAAFGIVFNLAVIILTFSTPSCGGRTRARRISCVSNLKQIGLSLKQYAMDYKDCFPHQDGVDGLEQSNHSAGTRLLTG